MSEFDLKLIKEDNKYKYGSKVPHTDAEVFECISLNYNKDVGGCLSGIYKINRLEGLDVLESWRRTLLLHVSSFKKAA